MNRIITNKTEAAIICSHVEERAARLKEEILHSETKVSVTGTKYYFAESGDDANDGLSPETPKKTLDGVNALTLIPGDGVFFKRGDIFRGHLFASRGVTYSAYGEGEKPRLYNSRRNYAAPDIWVETDVKNVYKLTAAITNDAGIIVFNDGEAWGEKRIKGRKNFPDGNLCDLDRDLTFWHDVPLPTKETGFLYLRSDKGNPGERFASIEIGTREHVISHNDDVTFDNLCIRYGGAHGIGSGTHNGIVCRYCEFSWIGGSWFRTDVLSRYGNAFEIYGGCRGLTLDHNYVSQIYDAGLTCQYKSGEGELIMVDMKFTNNLIEDTSYSIEYFLTDADNEPPETEKPRSPRYIKNFEISGNILRRSGYGWGSQRPDISAAAHIKGWDHYNKSWGYTVNNNIFDRASYMMVHIGADKPEWLPEMKNNLYIAGGEENSTYGLFGKCPIPRERLPFDETMEKNLEEVVHETDSTVVLL